MTPTVHNRDKWTLRSDLKLLELMQGLSLKCFFIFIIIEIITGNTAYSISTTSTSRL